jgi:hypothetical protein
MNAAAAHRTASGGARESRQPLAGLPRLLDFTDLRRGSGLFLTTRRSLGISFSDVVDCQRFALNASDSRKGGAMSKIRRCIAIALAAALTAFVAAVAAPAASGEPSAVFTTITTNFTSSFAAVNPCTGGTGTVELAGRDVLHVTDFGGGSFHVVDTQTGILTFTPDDPSALTLVGHYTTTFSDQSNPPGLQFTVGRPFNVVAVGADGSRVVFNLIARTTRSPDGTVTVSFDVTHFECVRTGGVRRMEG